MLNTRVSMSHYVSIGDLINENDGILMTMVSEDLFYDYGGNCCLSVGGKDNLKYNIL